MYYALEITPAYRRQCKKLAVSLQKTVRHTLDRLCEAPFKSNLDVKKLQGREGYRLRIGDYRVIYRLDKEKLVVIALEIGHRKEYIRKGNDHENPTGKRQDVRARPAQGL